MDKPRATTVALACYFCFADIILISQCTYYNTLNSRRRSRSTQRRRRLSSTATNDTDATAVSEDPSEEDPLLSGRSRRRSESLGLPGSHRRHSVRRRESNLDPLTRIITGEDDTPDSNPWLHNSLSLVAVWVVGASGWFYWATRWAPGTCPMACPSMVVMNSPSARPEKMIGMVLGYISAVCYLWYASPFLISPPSSPLKQPNWALADRAKSARIPQIIKNYQEKSCEGLALLFFLLSLTGNFTYGASVISYSQGSRLLHTRPSLAARLGGYHGGRLRDIRAVQNILSGSAS